MTRESTVSPLRRPLGVTLYFACHAAAAGLLALPSVALVSSTGIGRFPDGDRLLFQPGGTLLAEVARALGPALPPHVASSLGTGTLLGVALLVPHAALLVVLSRAEREPQSTAWGHALGHLPAMLSLSGLAFLAQVIVLAGAASVAAMVRGAMNHSTARSADLAYLAILGVGGLFAVLLGITRDLGRAAAVRGSLGGKAALIQGLKTLAGSPGRSLVGWAAPAAAGIALVALGAVLTAAIDVSRPGDWRVLSVGALHQAIAFALCWCRAFWLGASLGLVARTTEPSA